MEENKAGVVSTEQSVRLISFTPGAVVYLKSDIHKKIPLTIESIQEETKMVCLYFNPMTMDIKRETISFEALKLIYE